MNKKHRFILTISILILVLLLSLTSCAKKETNKTEERKPEVYKIGVILSLTGAGSPLGIPERNALEMLADEINGKGGIDGIKLELIIEDDQTDPAKASQAARKLIEKDKVIALIGSSVSPCSLAIKEIVARYGIPWMCPSAANAITEGDIKWVFRTAPKDAVAVEALLNYISKNTKYKRLAILHDSNAFGQSGADEIKKRSVDFNVEIVSIEKYETNAPDLSSQLTKIKQSNPDAIIVWGTNPGPAIAAKNMKQLGLNIQYFGSHGIANKKFIELAGDAAEGVIFPAGKILVADQLDDGDPVKEYMLEFASKYEKRFKEKPVTFTAHTYDALNILVESIKKAKSIEPEKLREAIESTKDYIGLDGTIDYSKEDHDGIGIDDLVIVKIENGKWIKLQ
ncbi:MAG: ABC transporter substrate-binding protein [Actinobacteria bacterium]|nr:ABC transporter substrate-binding protein [Actinomycetota bacterium]